MARSRTALAFVMGIAAGFVLGWVLAPQGGGPVGEAIVPARSDARSEKPGLAEGSAAAEPATEPDASAGSPPTTEGDSRALRMPLEDFPRLRVRVLEASGAPTVHADVYALRAGSPGAETEHEVASDYGAQGGEYDLPVPAPGTYDVGATLGNLFVLREDVRVPLGETLELRLPPVDVVEVEASPELVARLRPTREAGGGREREEDRVVLSFAPVTERRAVRYPGRGEVRGGASEASVGLLPEEPRGQVRVPRGSRWRLTAAKSRFPVSVSPDEFEAPARLTVAPAGARLHLAMHLPPDGLAFERRTTVVAYLSVRGVEGERVAHETYAAGEARRPLRWAWTVPVDAGVLSWRGPGLRPGEVRFAAGADGEAHVEVTAVVEGPLPSAAPDSRRTTRVRIVAAEPGPPAEASLMAVGEGVDAWVLDWDPVRGRGTSDVRGEFSWICAYGSEPGRGDTWVSRSVPSTTPEPIELRLRRGGWLVLSPDRWLPEELSLQVTRPGGILDDGGEWGESRAVRPGMIVGPFEPGPLRLSVRLGGAEIGEVVPTVLAGEIVPVVIPTSPPPR